MAEEKMRKTAVKPALCLDWDGTIRYGKNGFIQKLDDIVLFDDIEDKIWDYRNKGYLIIGVSNQGGVAFGYRTWKNVEDEMDKTLSLFKKNPFHIVKMCYHHPKGKVFPFNYRSLLRKPDTGMLAISEFEAWKSGYIIDWDKSVFVGDRPEDYQCATSAGVKFIHANNFFERNISCPECGSGLVFSDDDKPESCLNIHCIHPIDPKDALTDKQLKQIEGGK